MKRKLMVGVWSFGVLVSVAWIGVGLYQMWRAHDLSIETVTLLLFWFFVGRKALSYLRRELRVKT